ncbi:MAG: hypothetical protein AAB654_02440, partial [Acidobacteriota bacterium]
MRPQYLSVFICGFLLFAGQQPEVKFEATSSLVVVNLSVRDRSGKIVEGLKEEDFQVFDDDKPQ